MIRDLLCVRDIAEKSLNILLLILKSSHRRYSVEKGALKNFANFTDLCRSFLAYNFIKKRLQRSCFPVKCGGFLRTPILKNIWERLLLYLHVTLFTMHEKDTANEA